MQFLLRLNCVIVKISSFAILYFCCQCFLIYILFEKFFFLIQEDLKIFITLAINVFLSSDWLGENMHQKLCSNGS